MTLPPFSNQWHTVGCNTPHDCCTDAPTDAEDSSSACHVFPATIDPDGVGLADIPKGNYLVFLFCHCGTMLHAHGKVWGNRQSANKWARKRLSAGQFKILQGGR